MTPETAEAGLIFLYTISIVVAIGFGLFWFGMQFGEDVEYLSDPAEIAKNNGQIRRNRTTRPGFRHYVVLVMGILSFLWVPWFFYGVHSLWRANIGAINDCQRQERVLPPAERVRPSVQDMPSGENHER